MPYFKSPIYRQLDPSTCRSRHSILERFCQTNNDGDKPYALLLPRHVRSRRDAVMYTRSAANMMIKTMRQLFRFATRYDLNDTNLAGQVEYLATNPDGYHSLTLEEIEAYEKAHPVGSMAWLALVLALYTGQRRSDPIWFGWQDLREDNDGILWLSFTQHNGRSRHPITLEIPTIRELQRPLEANGAGNTTFLVNN